MTDTDDTSTETFTAYRLANEADIACPSSPTSPGALFLLGVQTHAAETLAYDTDADPSDTAHEIADGAVPVYTFDVWQTFTDLAAYQEDDETGGMAEAAGAGDMTTAAQIALYQIAHRLATFLLATYSGEDDDA